MTVSETTPSRSASPFDFFDRIFCINLDTRTDRWQRARLEFAKLGILERVERFAAIPHEIGAEGCRQSHATVRRLAVDSGCETLLVFEDDVAFLDGATATLTNALIELQQQPDWEQLFLGGLVRSRAKRLSPHLFSANIVEMHAYALHRRAFSKLEDPTRPVDFCYAARLKQLGCRPLIAVQSESHSDIDGEFVDWRASTSLDSYQLYVESSGLTYWPRIVWRDARWRSHLAMKKLRRFTSQR